MSKLEELMAELCPDGVPFRTIGECVKPISNIKWSCSNDAEYQYIDLTSVNRDTHNIGETQTICADNAPSRAQQIVYAQDILLGTTRPLLRRFCVVPNEYSSQMCSTGFCVLRADENIVLHRWLYHQISTSKFFDYVEKHQKGASYPAISDADVKKFRIPIPPLSVQREIVRILDNFAELTEGLNRELTAELTARKKQYAYYRDKLLTPRTDYRHGKIIDMLKQPITDGPHTTPELMEDGIPFLSVEAVFDGKIHFEKRRGNITPEFDAECCKKYKPQNHDIFMVKSGSTTGKVGYVDTDERFNIWSPLAAMRVNSENSSRYLFHLLQSKMVQQQVVAKASHGSQPNLSMRALEQFDVVIPPLDIQLRLADVLDNFDAICTDLSSGLPAEIEARQKQYEYYRDRLLSFEEKI